MAAITINLSTNPARQYFDSHGANITAQTAMSADVEISINLSTNTVVAELRYYVSEAAKQAGGTPTPIFYVENGIRTRAKERFQATIADNTAFGALTVLAMAQAIEGLIETEVFGAGTATIVV